MKAKPKKKTVRALEWLDHGCYPGHTLLVYNYEYDDIIKYLKKIKADG